MGYLENLLDLDQHFVKKIIALIAGAFAIRIVLPTIQKLIYDRYITDRTAKKKENKKKSQIQSLLLSNLKNNILLLISIEDHLTGKKTGGRQLPTFNIDIKILESMAGLNMIDFLGEIETYEKIDKARYELSHVGRKVDWLAEMWLKNPMIIPSESDSPSHSYKENVFYGLVISTLKLVRTCIEDCLKAIEALESNQSITIK